MVFAVSRARPAGMDAVREEEASLEIARTAVDAADWFAGQYTDIDKVCTRHGDNHVPLVARRFRKDRAAMPAMVEARL
jgi:hypothetical protein